MDNADQGKFKSILQCHRRPTCEECWSLAIFSFGEGDRIGADVAGIDVHLFHDSAKFASIALSGATLHSDLELRSGFKRELRSPSGVAALFLKLSPRTKPLEDELPLHNPCCGMCLSINGLLLMFTDLEGIWRVRFVGLPLVSIHAIPSCIGSRPWCSTRDNN